MTIPAYISRKSPVSAILNGAAAFTSSLCISSILLFVLSPMVGLNGDYPFIVNTSWFIEMIEYCWRQATISLESWESFKAPTKFLSNFIRQLDRFDLEEEFGFRLLVLLCVIFISTLTAAFYAHAFVLPADRLIHLRGRRLIRGKAATRVGRLAGKKSIKRTGTGIEIAPKLKISLDTETKHSLLVGASGAGKTQILRFWIEQTLQQNSRVVCHDTKGDITAGLPIQSFILLAPHDERTWSWDIAKDCVGYADAHELAGRFISEPLGDKMWTEGARQILAGLVHHLQIAKKENWNWTSLRDLVFSSPAEIKSVLEETKSKSSQFIDLDGDGIPSKTTMSFLVTLWSYVGRLITPLAVAWADTPADKQISLRKWLKGSKELPKAIVMQRSAEYSELSEAWIGAAIQLMANEIASASFGDSSRRRIWMFLDEFAQLGKLKGFHQFLEVGRSRGVRCALGLQDIEQLKDLYGPEATNTWLNSVETKIICRMNSGPSSKFIAEDLIGTREVSWRETTYSTPVGSSQQNGGRTINSHMRRETIPVVLPDFLERDLGPFQRGGETKIKALLMSKGNLLELEWPITHWPQRRPGSKPAAWTLE